MSPPEVTVGVLRVSSSSSLIHSQREGTPRAHPGHARASLCFAPEVWQICRQKPLARRHLRLHVLCVGMFSGEGVFVTMNQSYESFTRKLEEPLFPHESPCVHAALHSLLIKKSLSLKQDSKPFDGKGTPKETSLGTLHE